MKESVAIVCLFGYLALVLYGTYQATVIHGWSAWWWLLAVALLSIKANVGDKK